MVFYSSYFCIRMIYTNTFLFFLFLLTGLNRSNSRRVSHLNKDQTCVFPLFCSCCRLDHPGLQKSTFGRNWKVWMFISIIWHICAWLLVQQFGGVSGTEDSDGFAWTEGPVMAMLATRAGPDRVITLYAVTADKRLIISSYPVCRILSLVLFFAPWYSVPEGEILKTKQLGHSSI